MLYGVIYGDVAGSTYESKLCHDYKFITIPSKSSFTDDTVMTCAVACWLMQNPSDIDLLIKEMQRWGSKYPNVSYGGKFREWLNSENPSAYYSFGNGSAMRVAPCGWFADTLQEAEDLAKASASVTHNHPEGIKGAQAVAAAIFLARLGWDKVDIKDYLITEYGYNLDRTIKEIIDSGYSFDVSCQGSVPEAIIAFLEGNSFEEVIRLAILLGGDADTQAAIAGSIAEAYYGVPEDCIYEIKKYLTDDIIEVITNFKKFYNEKFPNYPRG